MPRLWDDIKWGIMMIKIRRRRRNMLFSTRKRFDKELQPLCYEDDQDKARIRILYPDAVYMINQHDFDRAIFKTQWYPIDNLNEPSIIQSSTRNKPPVS